MDEKKHFLLYDVLQTVTKSVVPIYHWARSIHPRQSAAPLHLLVLPSLAACLEPLRMVRKKLSASFRLGRLRCFLWKKALKVGSYHTFPKLQFHYQWYHGTSRPASGDKGGARWQAACVAGETRLGASLSGESLHPKVEFKIRPQNYFWWTLMLLMEFKI